MHILCKQPRRSAVLRASTTCAESARAPLQAIVDKSLGSGITRVIVSPIANKRVQLVVGARAAALLSIAATCSDPAQRAPCFCYA
jgi:hypothetical protein